MTGSTARVSVILNKAGVVHKKQYVRFSGIKATNLREYTQNKDFCMFSLYECGFYILLCKK